MTKVIEKKLGRHKALGMTDEWNPKGRIFVDPRQRPKSRLRTVVHEAIHKAWPHLRETEVLRGEKIIGDILWSDNYRQTKQ